MSEGRPGRAAPLYVLVVETAPSGASPGERRKPPARHEILARETVIGRAPAATIRLDDPFVSGEHARLLLRDHALHLDDLGSTNATRRNGDQVRTRVRVVPGDVLEFGGARCRLESADEPEERPIPAAGPEPPSLVGETAAGDWRPGPAAARPVDEAPPPGPAAEPGGERGLSGRALPEGAPPDRGLPRVFIAGPLPGEPRRSRVRAALWFAAALALAVLVAALLR